MCGIAGIFRFDETPVDREALARMGRALAHRGPDGMGHEVLGPCGLAHRRLAIIDLSEDGHQPMSTGEGRFWISYNGEVYNYVELRKELESAGHQFRSHTDTEVILQAYCRWGKDAFSRFNGMWGLAIYDRQERKLVLSRDRIGIKPVYLHRSDKRLLFASEIKSILACEPELAMADEANIARFLTRSSLSFGGRQSFFRDIVSLEPGSILELGADGRTQSSRYWHFQPSDTPRIRSFEEAKEAVRELFVDAVRLRFRADVPVGSCLSGGIDSSAIVSVSRRILGYTPHTFSAIYAQPECDESHFVRSLVRELGVHGHEVSPDGSDLPEVITRATYHQDGPTAGAGVYSQWHVMKLASGQVKVLLDGQGGDELFAGYFHNFAPYVRGLLRRAERGDLGAIRLLITEPARIKALSGSNPLDQMLRLGFARRKAEYYAPLRQKVIAYARGRLPPVYRAGMRISHLFDDQLPPSPPSGGYVRIISDPLMASIREERAGWATPALTGDPLTNVLWDEIVRTSLPGLLQYEDRDSMAFSIEARVPFLDHRLVELSFDLPPEAKIHGDVTKRVLRESLRGVLPDIIRERRDKMGYPTPVGDWLKDQHGDWVRDILLSEQCKQRGYFRADSVSQMLDEHRSGVRERGPEIYRMLTLELFARRFLDGRFEAETEATD